jgi:anti-sigma B factor antagonist
MGNERSPSPHEVPSNLGATVNPDTTVTRVRLTGELDLATEDRLDTVIGQALDMTPPVVVLDLQDVTFCDARGLAAILAAHHRLVANQRRLTLTGAGPPLRRILEVTHLDELLEIE